MNHSYLLHHLVEASAERSPESAAVKDKNVLLSYGSLLTAVRRFASGLIELGIERGARVAVYLDKREEFVIAVFGTSAAGAVFVPVNPLLKGEQVGYILRDCNVRVLVTSGARLSSLTDVLGGCADLRHVIVVDEAESVESLALHSWRSMQDGADRAGKRVIDDDMVAILYTSGSTGRPKGVVLSHRNMVAGAKSVAQYLENRASDDIARGAAAVVRCRFSQLTTAFHVGARVVLLNYLLPKDVLKALVQRARHRPHRGAAAVDPARRS